MMFLYLFFGGLFFLLAVVLLIHYNGLVTIRNHCDEAWHNIDTELKRRHDLIPNLVNTVKAYANHEKETLEKIVRLRESVVDEHKPSDEKARAEGELSQLLQGLVVRMEQYPDLKASTNFMELNRELVNTEDRIQAALRFYNANVRENNTKIEVFPSNLVASMFGFKSRNYFEIAAPGFRETPKVSF